MPDTPETHPVFDREFFDPDISGTPETDRSAAVAALLSPFAAMGGDWAMPAFADLEADVVVWGPVAGRSVTAGDVRAARRYLDGAATNEPDHRPPVDVEWEHVDRVGCWCQPRVAAVEALEWALDYIEELDQKRRPPLAQPFLNEQIIRYREVAARLGALAPEREEAGLRAALDSALDEFDNVRWTDIWKAVAAEDDALAYASRKYVGYIRDDIEKARAALSAPVAEGLDEAWAAAEAELPEGWRIVRCARVEMAGLPGLNRWGATAAPREPKGRGWAGIYETRFADGDTPAAALHALAARLSAKADSAAGGRVG